MIQDIYDQIAIINSCSMQKTQTDDALVTLINLIVESEPEQIRIIKQVLTSFTSLKENNSWAKDALYFDVFFETLFKFLEEPTAEDGKVYNFMLDLLCYFQEELEKDDALEMDILIIN